MSDSTSSAEAGTSPAVVGNAIYQINSRAVEIFQNGDFHRAGDLFRSALSRISSCSRDEDLPPPDQHREQVAEGDQDASLDSNSSQHSSIRPINLLREDEAPLKAASLLSNTQDQTAFALYDRAFVTVQDTDKGLLSIVVLYNLGLMYHWMGLCHGRSQKNVLEKALQLYEMSLDLVKGSVNVDVLGNLLLLAIYNNMGHIYAMFFNTEKTHYCLEQVRHILEATTAAHPDNDQRGDYVLFRMNLLFLQILKSPAASAA